MSDNAIAQLNSLLNKCNGQLLSQLCERQHDANFARQSSKWLKMLDSVYPAYIKRWLAYYDNPPASSSRTTPSPSSSACATPSMPALEPDTTTSSTLTSPVPVQPPQLSFADAFPVSCFECRTMESLMVESLKHFPLDCPEVNTAAVPSVRFRAVLLSFNNMAKLCEQRLGEKTAEVEHLHGQLMQKVEHLRGVQVDQDALLRGAQLDQDEKSRLHTQLQSKRRRIEELEQGIQGIKDDCEARVKRVKDEAVQAEQALQGQLRQQAAEMGRVQSQLKAQSSEMEALRTQLVSIVRERDNTGKGLESVTHELQATKDELATAARERVNMAAEIAGLQTSLDDKVVEVVLRAGFRTSAFASEGRDERSEKKLQEVRERNRQIEAQSKSHTTKRRRVATEHSKK